MKEKELTCIFLSINLLQKLKKIRNQNKESERQTKIEKHPDSKFFHRINLHVEGFYIFLEISKIQNYITQSNEEKLKSKFAEKLLNDL